MRAACYLVVVLGSLLSRPTAAQTAPPDCRPAEPMPPELGAWPDRAPLAAAADRAMLGGAVLPVGRAVDASLHRTPDVNFVSLPEQPGGSVSFGGMFTVEVVEAGSYRVAIGSAAWIDVLVDGAAVLSTAHGRGPGCSGIRKMVTFPLPAGRHVLQLSANAERTLPLLVARVP